MNFPKEQRVHSRTDILKVLQSLTDSQEPCVEASTMRREWETLNSRTAEVLEPYGQDGWDYVLMEWPNDILLFNLIINSKSLYEYLNPIQIYEIINSLTLPWIVRVEFIDRIVNEAMVGGDDLAEWILDKTRFYSWKQQ